MSRTGVSEAEARRARRVQIERGTGKFWKRLRSTGVFISRSEHLCIIRVHEYTINEIHHIVCHRARAQKSQVVGPDFDPPRWDA